MSDPCLQVGKGNEQGKGREGKGREGMEEGKGRDEERDGWN